jgi:hypothetical protein
VMTEEAGRTLLSCANPIGPARETDHGIKDWTLEIKEKAERQRLTWEETGEWSD